MLGCGRSPPGCSSGRSGDRIAGNGAVANRATAEGEQVAVLENRGFGDAAGFGIGDARGGVVFGYLETRTPRQNAM
jgi:hypothetical protein